MRKLLISLFLFIVVNNGYSQKNKIYTAVDCPVVSVTIKGDTIIAYVNDSCTHYTFNPIRDGKWMLYSSRDSSRLTYSAQVKNNQFDNFELTYFNDGSLSKSAFYKNGQVRVIKYYWEKTERIRLQEKFKFNKRVKSFTLVSRKCYNNEGKQMKCPQ